MNEKQDVVAKYPKDISDYYRINGKFPDNFKFEEGYICALNGERYFIHTRAVLPLKAFEKGIGFGLWVELSRDDFFNYINIGDDDEKYKNFKVEGKLANEWPGFENMIGTRVVVRTVFVADKVYITEVLDLNDVLFQVSTLADVNDEEKIKQIESLVYAYLEDVQLNLAPDF